MNGFFSKFCPKVYGKSVGTALHVPRGAICRKQVFLGRLIVCFLFPDFYRKAFGLSAKKSASLSKLHSTSPQEHFEEKIYHVFWSSNGLFSKFCPKTCGKSVRSALYVPRGAICRKQVFIGRLIVCSLFSDFYRKAFGLSAKKSAGLSKLHSTFPQEHFKEKVYHVFLELERIFFQILAENLGQVCRNCIVRGQTSHSRKTNGFRKAKSLSFVFGFLVECFRDVGKKHRHVCQKCILYFHRKNLRTKLWKISCLFFRIFGRKFWKL